MIILGPVLLVSPSLKRGSSCAFEVHRLNFFKFQISIIDNVENSDFGYSIENQTDECICLQKAAQDLAECWKELIYLCLFALGKLFHLYLHFDRKGAEKSQA